MIIKRIKDFFAFERNIFTIIIANFFIVSGLYLWDAFQPKYFASLGASIFVVGILVSLGKVMYPISCTIGGLLSDKYGRKKTFVTASFISCFSLLIYLFSPSWVFLVPAIIISSFSGGISSTASDTIVAESLKKRKRATGFSSIYLFGQIPLLFVVPLGGFIVEKMGILSGVRLSIAISFVLFLFYLFILSYFLRETLRKNITTKIKLSLRNSLKFFAKIKTNVKSLIMINAIILFAGGTIWTFVVFYALDVVKITALQFGILGSIAAFSSITFLFFGGKLSDKYGRRPIILFSLLVYAITPVVLLFSKNFVSLVAVYLLNGLGSIGFASWTPYVTENTEKGNRAKTIGLNWSIGALGSIPGPIVGGFLYSILPIYTFVFGFVLSVTALLIGLKYLS